MQPTAFPLSPRGRHPRRHPADTPARSGKSPPDVARSLSAIAPPPTAGSPRRGRWAVPSTWHPPARISRPVNQEIHFPRARAPEEQFARTPRCPSGRATFLTPPRFPRLPRSAAMSSVHPAAWRRKRQIGVISSKPCPMRQGLCKLWRFSPDVLHFGGMPAAALAGADSAGLGGEFILPPDCRQI
jgi:hypothetical protein